MHRLKSWQACTTMENQRREGRGRAGTGGSTVLSGARFSAASIWEIGIKASLGKLTASPREILDSIEPAGFTLLPITGEHAVKVGELPPIHKDPFDRMLVAQASVEPMILLTNDDALRDYGLFVTVT
jgi:PIN domain nuclease of toxin-antitoxin system